MSFCLTPIKIRSRLDLMQCLFIPIFKLILVSESAMRIQFLLTIRGILYKKGYINKYFLPFPVGLQFVAENECCGRGRPVQICAQDSSMMSVL